MPPMPQQKSRIHEQDLPPTPANPAPFTMIPRTMMRNQLAGTAFEIARNGAGSDSSGKMNPDR